ncbi:MAG: NrfD/PsrC family molybdoenzyme membrane anchor subunit [Nitrososphaeria archaeon]
MEPFNQKEFGWTVALDFLLSGTGSSMYLAYRLLFLKNPDIIFVGPALVVLGLFVLLSELGSPRNFWRSITNYRTSWMARGAIFNAAFLLIWAIMLVTYAFGFYALLALFEILELPVAVLVLIYPVMLLKDVKDITLWKSAGTATVTTIYAIAGGISADAMLVSALRPVQLVIVLYASSSIELILTVSLYIYLHRLGRAQSRAVEASYRKITGKRHMLTVLYAGTILPLAADLASLALIQFAMYFMLMSLALSIAGVYAFRLLLLQAGYHEPLVSEKMIRKVAKRSA